MTTMNVLMIVAIKIPDANTPLYLMMMKTLALMMVVIVPLDHITLL
jgi:hypothetical protein